VTKTAKNLQAADQVVTMDRRHDERRDIALDSAEVATEPQRRKKQRRRQIDPTTCERDYSGDEIEFMQAMDAYKRAAGRMFPTCSEILEVVRSIGYVRLTEDQIEQLNISDDTSDTDSFDYNADDDFDDEDLED
jgi:hypothetical protein